MPYSAEYVAAHIKGRSVVEDRGHATACWIWQGGINNAGYATGRPAGCRHGVMHRKAYGAFIGPIPDGYVVDHLCRVRCCVNPEHLEAVTNGENVRRSWRGQKRRAKPTARETKRAGGPSDGAGRRTQQSMSLTHRAEASSR